MRIAQHVKMTHGVRRGFHSAQISSILMLLALVACSGPGNGPAGFVGAGDHKLAAPAEVGACVTSTPPSGLYHVTVCLVSPSGGSTLKDNITTKATVTVTGSAQAVQRVTFYLDGAYLLTDYQASYTFVLTTANWVDGNHKLAVNAVMRDGFVTQRASASVIFANGVTNVPANPNHFQPTNGRDAASGSPFIVAAGGDGASGQSTSDRVVDLLHTFNPNLFLYLGDVYERGTKEEFYNWYGVGSSSFSFLRSITDPTVGNHEYLTTGAAGYYDFWNNIPKYYSFNANGWHFISLNSNTSYVPGAVGSAQYNWLQNDLAGLPSQTCTVVFYHHPLYNIGSEGNATGMTAIWQLLAKYHVDIVLNGHDHDYQRWKPLDGNGALNGNGITEFVAGGAGHGLQTSTRTDSRVAYSNDQNPTAFGLLLLQLNSRGANYNYRNISGAVLDSGVIPCRPATLDSTPPTAPGSFGATAPVSNRVQLTWTPSSDNVGVVGYKILRNGVIVASIANWVDLAQLKYLDHAVVASTTYKYSIYAYDLHGNHSATVGPITVKTPTASLPDMADTYLAGN